MLDSQSWILIHAELCKVTWFWVLGSRSFAVARLKNFLDGTGSVQENKTTLDFWSEMVFNTGITEKARELKLGGLLLTLLFNVTPWAQGPSSRKYLLLHNRCHHCHISQTHDPEDKRIHCRHSCLLECTCHGEVSLLSCTWGAFPWWTSRTVATKSLESGFLFLHFQTFQMEGK